jgi:DNA repair ATPase RecN
MRSMTEAIPYWFVVIAMGILAFFLIRFWYTVDEIRKDVKSMLIAQSEHKETINAIKERIREIRAIQRDHKEEIAELDKDVDKLKNNK